MISSEDGNAANSFKSMKSYILGDLDISSEENDLESFEISSNSSQEKQTPKSSNATKRNNSQPSVKRFQEDEEQDCYLRDEAFQGFIAK